LGRYNFKPPLPLRLYRLCGTLLLRRLHCDAGGHISVSESWHVNADSAVADLQTWMLIILLMSESMILYAMLLLLLAGSR